MRRCRLICSVFLIALASVQVQSTVLIGSVAGSPGDGMADVPIEGAYVYIADTHPVVSTDSGGEFVFDAVPEGKYDVAVFHRTWGWATAVLQVSGDTVRKGIHTRMPLLLEPQGSCWEPIVKFTGRVVDHSTGDGIPDALLRTGEHASGCGKYSTWADGSGLYEWKLSVDPESVLVLAPGFHPLRAVVSAEPPDPGVRTHVVSFLLALQGSNLKGFALTSEGDDPTATLPDGQLLRDGDAPLPMGPYGVVNVTVVDSETGTPVPRACLWIYDLAQGVRLPASASYAIGPLQPRRYTIIAIAYDHWMKPVPFEVSKPPEGKNCSIVPLTLSMYLQP